MWNRNSGGKSVKEGNIIEIIESNSYHPQILKHYTNLPNDLKLSSKFSGVSSCFSAILCLKCMIVQNVWFFIMEKGRAEKGEWKKIFVSLTREANVYLDGDFIHTPNRRTHTSKLYQRKHRTQTKTGQAIGQKERETLTFITMSIGLIQVHWHIKLVGWDFHFPFLHF